MVKTLTSIQFWSIIVLFSSFPAHAQELEFTDDPENLGHNVNTKYSDLSPIISPDGKTLYFDRKNYPQNTGGVDDEDEIWFSTLNTDGTWSVGKNIGSPLNNKGHNFIKSISPDGNAILLGNVYNYFDGSMSQGCSMSYRSRGGWTYPKKQNIEKYENRNDYVGYYLSNDGKVLFMSIEMKKGFGERDIYVSFKEGENEWSRPLNMGASINTGKDDSAPFLAADGVTFYFSTSGHGGYGSNDIWMTKRLDDTWTNWSELVNMGPKINSSDWDSYFTIPASGEYAYFVSSKSGEGEEDIFRIKLPTEAKPDPVVLIYGQVLNAKTKEPVKADIRYEYLPEGKEAGIARSEPVKGEYKIVLPYGYIYGFRAISQGFYAVSENIDVSDLKEYKEIKKDLYLAPIEKDQVVRLNNIFFEFGKSVLKKESFPELDRVVKLMEENPSVEIELSGHTDNVGSDDANLKLSQERAQSVVNYLSKKGVKSKRLIAKGYGETMPVATNDTDEGRQLNRRVEFKILAK